MLNSYSAAASYELFRMKRLCYTYQYTVKLSCIYIYSVSQSSMLLSTHLNNFCPNVPEIDSRLAHGHWRTGPLPKFRSVRVNELS